MSSGPGCDRNGSQATNLDRKPSLISLLLGTRPNGAQAAGGRKERTEPRLPLLLHLQLRRARGTSAFAVPREEPGRRAAGRAATELRGEPPLPGCPAPAPPSPGRAGPSGLVPQRSRLPCPPAHSRGEEGTAHSTPESAPVAGLSRGGRPGWPCLSGSSVGCGAGASVIRPPTPCPEEGRGRMGEAEQLPGGSCAGPLSLPPAGSLWVVPRSLATVPGGSGPGHRGL